MSLGVKIKLHDEMYSMFLVPKRLYYSLIKNTEDNESKKELISMNEKPETTNYIENAIKFKNLQDRQKINQTGDKLLRYGPDKLPNVTSVTQSHGSMGRTYQSVSRSPSAHVMSPGRVDCSMDRTNRSLSTSTTAQIPQQEEFSTPMIERQPDTERCISSERTKSLNESAYSTPVLYSTQWREWRETPVAVAMTQRNSKGKLVCPIYDCRKQHVDEAQLANIC